MWTRLNRFSGLSGAAVVLSPLVQRSFSLLILQCKGYVFSEVLSWRGSEGRGLLGSEGSNLVLLKNALVELKGAHAPETFGIRHV